MVVAIQWVCWPWGFLGGAGQVQPLPMFFLGHPEGAIKQSEMAATCAGLGDFHPKPSCGLVWLLLVPCLGPLSRRYRGWGLTEANCCLFERI